MKILKSSLMAGAAALTIAAPAGAADLPPPMYKSAPVVVQTSGWYLRGDIGMTNQQVKSIDNALFDSTVVVHNKDFDTGILAGLGGGYQFNDWFRVDVTGEYRGRTAFRGFDTYPGGAGFGPGANDYYGTKSEWLFLANAYLDLGTWWCFTPFVGAGIGTSRNTIDNFRDVNAPNGSVAYADKHSQWEMAWALHAGIAYKVTKNFTAEFAYRYVNLGDFQSGDLVRFDGLNAVNNPMIFHDVTSHDFKLALRWNLSPNDAVIPVAAPAYAPPPAVYNPPAPAYAPPPPLMRKG
ncbi:outer membrane protein [Pseudorhodoplanes sp.]|jgi:opacity protein-like surface antigen|uniref:outer membrane protein n=1 Tax=Pseudorhodoplanes sp. TaxID=1934341 RepID=UPI002D1B93DC|nr:outer membrane beta-barrel protein [Pseudorhodoplanes sp.]HWV41234.1 outer membrane beta-barrel protein [Pseudorhodoplanes sp.]